MQHLYSSYYIYENVYVYNMTDANMQVCDSVPACVHLCVSLRVSTTALSHALLSVGAHLWMKRVRENLRWFLLSRKTAPYLSITPLNAICHMHITKDERACTGTCYINGKMWQPFAECLIEKNAKWKVQRKSTYRVIPCSSGSITHDIWQTFPKSWLMIVIHLCAKHLSIG